MKWNEKYSIRLSKVCVALFALTVVALALTAPWVVNWFVKFSRAMLLGREHFLLVSIYAAVPAALVVLWLLWQLLGNLQKGRVFIPQNAAYLRGVSWCCIAAAGICLASGLYYLPFLLVAVLAGFMALIVRVVKNVFEQAIILQDDADYTI